MSLFLEAAEDAAIWGSGPGTVFTVVACLGLALAFNNPLWKEPEKAQLAAQEAGIVVKDANKYAWFGCTDTNVFSLYQTKVSGTNKAGDAVEATVCRTAFSSENQVITRTKHVEGKQETNSRSVTRVEVTNGLAKAVMP